MESEQDLERMRIEWYEGMSGENDDFDEAYETERGYDNLARGGVGKPTPPERHTWIIAVYHAEMAWGGPEEGGWWYDVGSLVRIVRLERSEERAYQYARKLNSKLQSRVIGPNQGKRDKSSVLSDGVDEAHVHQDSAPREYPATLPHYE